MVRILLSIFFILHGLVHLLYFGQSARYFELQGGMTWPDRSWAFSRLLGDSAARNLACTLLILIAIGFVIGGIGLLAKQVWWRPTIVGAAIVSTFTYILFWDGGIQHLDNKGGIGILINLVILVTLLIIKWPMFDF